MAFISRSSSICILLRGVGSSLDLNWVQAGITWLITSDSTKSGETNFVFNSNHRWGLLLDLNDWIPFTKPQRARVMVPNNVQSLLCNDLLLLYSHLTSTFLPFLYHSSPFSLLSPLLIFLYHFSIQISVYGGVPPQGTGCLFSLTHIGVV